MIDFQQKRQFNKIIYSKLSFVVLFILIIFLIRPTYYIYKKSRLSFDNYTVVKKDYENLKTRKDMLESEIDRLKTDSGMEEEIRGKFNVSKPGETVVVIINNSTSTDANDQNKSFWSSLLNLFK